jgi:hypothetical protein
LLTGEGVLKVGGFGEPPWLTSASAFGEDAAADLLALGRLAAEWSTAARAAKGSRVKPLPPTLQTVLNRLTSEDTTLRFASVATLLEELEKVAATVPANPEAWDRLVRHVKENATPLATLRQSA